MQVHTYTYIPTVNGSIANHYISMRQKMNLMWL